MSVERVIRGGGHREQAPAGVGAADGDPDDLPFLGRYLMREGQ